MIILHMLSKLCALVGFSTIPLVTNGLVTLNNGIMTIILAFLFCAVLESGKINEKTN